MSGGGGGGAVRYGAKPCFLQSGELCICESRPTVGVAGLLARMHERAPGESKRMPSTSESKRTPNTSRRREHQRSREERADYEQHISALVAGDAEVAFEAIIFQHDTVISPQKEGYDGERRGFHSMFCSRPQRDRQHVLVTRVQTETLLCVGR